MAAVLAGLEQFTVLHPDSDIIVKFLLSIDRRNDTAAAMDTVSALGSCGVYTHGGRVYKSRQTLQVVAR